MTQDVRIAEDRTLRFKVVFPGGHALWILHGGNGGGNGTMWFDTFNHNGSARYDDKLTRVVVHRPGLFEKERYKDWSDGIWYHDSGISFSIRFSRVSRAKFNVSARRRNVDLPVSDVRLAGSGDWHNKTLDFSVLVDDGYSLFSLYAGTSGSPDTIEVLETNHAGVKRSSVLKRTSHIPRDASMQPSIQRMLVFTSGKSGRSDFFKASHSPVLTKKDIQRVLMKCNEEQLTQSFQDLLSMRDCSAYFTRLTTDMIVAAILELRPDIRYGSEQLEMAVLDIYAARHAYKQDEDMRMFFEELLHVKYDLTSKGLSPGSVVPNLTLLTLSGENVQLQSICYDGKTVLIVGSGS